eukprot:m.143406 g.143406  ORF g.143406 m.143406 type:complete len:81 (-) comp14090_c0_seq1:145-387(-)
MGRVNSAPQGGLCHVTANSTRTHSENGSVVDSAPHHRYHMFFDEVATDCCRSPPLLLDHGHQIQNLKFGNCSTLATSVVN